MTSTNWLCGVRTGLGVGLLTAGMVIGSAGGALADPTTSPAPAPTQAAGTATATGTGTGTATAQGASAAQSSGDILDQLAEEYAVGSGGGQLSNLLKISLKLRAMGFKPSKANLEELQQAMTYRPNQNPLINALKDTIAYQSKLKGQLEILQQAQAGQNANSAVMGAGQMPGASNPAQLPVGPVAQVPSDAVPVTP